MATATADNYAAPSGVMLRAGRYASRLSGGLALDDVIASGLLAQNLAALSGGLTLDAAVASGAFGGYNPPTWLAGRASNEFFAISGTSGYGSAILDAWGCLTLREDTSEIFVAAQAGHTDGSDNRVVSCDLTANAPSWTLRSAASSSFTNNASYNPDGKPGARHTYQHNHWIPQVGRVMMFGQRGRSSDGGDNYTVDGFDPATNTWDASGTWSSLSAGRGFGAVKNASNGEVYTPQGWKWTPGTNAWTQPYTSFPFTWRFPAAFDSLRNQVFSLQWADGQGFAPNVLNAGKFSTNSVSSAAITFNSSPALTQFINNTPSYCGMDYDPINDRFLFYDGATPGTVYVITPNAGITWDMSFVSFGAGNSVPPASSSAGINGRFKYVPALRGFVLAPRASSSLYFLKTA